MVRAVDCQVIHCVGRLVLEIFGKIYEAVVSLEELIGHLSHPVRYGRGEEAHLKFTEVNFTLDGVQNLLKIIISFHLLALRLP